MPKKITPEFNQSTIVTRIHDKMIDATSDDTFDDVLQDTLSEPVFENDKDARKHINIEFDEGMCDFVSELNDERDNYGREKLTAEEVLDTANVANELVDFKILDQFGNLMDENELNFDDQITDKNKQVFLNSVADVVLAVDDPETITEATIDAKPYEDNFSDVEIASTLIDELDNYDETATIDDMFNDLYNTDYYIMGYGDAENSMSVDFEDGQFGALEDVVNRENEKYGENYINSEIMTDPERLANLVEYEKADDILENALTHVSLNSDQLLNRDDNLTAENKTKLKEGLIYAVPLIDTDGIEDDGRDDQSKEKNLLNFNGLDKQNDLHL